jgi:hypothetical protein
MWIIIVKIWKWIYTPKGIFKVAEEEKNGDKYKRLTREHNDWAEEARIKFNQKMEMKRLMKENEVLENQIVNSKEEANKVEEFHNQLNKYGQNQEFF